MFKATPKGVKKKNTQTSYFPFQFSIQTYEQYNFLTSHMVMASWLIPFFPCCVCMEANLHDPCNRLCAPLSPSNLSTSTSSSSYSSSSTSQNPPCFSSELQQFPISLGNRENPPPPRPETCKNLTQESVFWWPKRDWMINWGKSVWIPVVGRL